MSESPSRRVAVFIAPGCHLCEQALAVVQDVQSRAALEVEIIDITGDAKLEAGYRTLLPVIEIDGVCAFTYFVTVEALLERLETIDGSPPPHPGRAGTM
ncbi:glutaredoxin family protein [Gaiella sp.]|uniref:glutaredoxin family protein n=1 Tax=Gaiella sp. TaxID=2663207 RepID=UPI00326566F9